MGGLHVDRIFQNVYLQLALELPFGCRKRWEIGKLRDMLQSIKQSVHADHCSKLFQSGLVLLSIVSVFRLWGSSGVCTVAKKVLDSERCGN